MQYANGFGMCMLCHYLRVPVNCLISLGKNILIFDFANHWTLQYTWPVNHVFIKLSILNDQMDVGATKAAKSVTNKTNPVGSIEDNNRVNERNLDEGKYAGHEVIWGR